MKSKFLKFGASIILLIVATFIIGPSCSNSSPVQSETLPCSTTNEMIGIKMTNSGTNPEYNTFLFPTSNAAPVNNIRISPSRLFTYGGVYNVLSQDYVLISNNSQTGNANLIKINGAGLQTVSVLTGYYAEPVYLNNNLYFANIETISGVTTFKILDKNFVVLKSLTINASKVFTTSATDNSRYIYYLSEPFLITYDKQNNTLVSCDLALGTNLLGLEFKNETTLLAIKASSGGSEIISLNITNAANVSVSTLFNLGLTVHPELYSTVYNSCNNKYYISEAFAGTGIIAADLNTNTKIIANLGANKIIGLAYKN